MIATTANLMASPNLFRKVNRISRWSKQCSWKLKFLFEVVHGGIFEPVERALSINGSSVTFS